jgi:hypothetical protein
MRKSHFIAAALVLIALFVPGAWYLTSRPSEDQLNDSLKSYGYLPINPPSNLMSLGSLYYVDSDVRFFKTVCAVEKDDLKDAVAESPGTTTLSDELRSGNYVIGVKLDAETVGAGHGGIDDKFVTKVHYSLSDVRIYEIALGTNRRIYNKLMANDDCGNAVLEYINAGGYVCQGQQILEATVEYDLRLESGRTIGTGVQTDANAVAKAIKVAMHADTTAQLDEKSGRLVAGSALKYGIAMNPTCLSPLTGRFQRVLPRNTFDRLMNFVKFRIIEPILPGT